VETERQRLITEVEGVAADVGRDKAPFAAIEEEGRQAGAYAGWFR
jgi:hypothetical protein